MGSVQHSVGGDKKAKRLGEVERVDRANYQGLKLDAKVELIRGLIPLDVMHVQELSMRRYDRSPGHGMRGQIHRRAAGPAHSHLRRFAPCMVVLCDDPDVAVALGQRNADLPLEFRRGQVEMMLRRPRPAVDQRLDLGHCRTGRRVDLEPDRDLVFLRFAALLRREDPYHRREDVGHLGLRLALPRFTLGEK